MKRFTLALGQMRVVGGDVTGNLARAAGMAQRAAAAGADLLLLPEALDCGWCDESAREHAGAVPQGASFRALAQIAADSRLVLCAGLTERRGAQLYNSAVLLDRDGRLLATHRKINELEIGRRVYDTGAEVRAVRETRLGTLGVMICADAFIEGETISRSLAEQGAELILSPCAWAVPPDHDQEREPYGGLWRDVYGRVARETRIWIAGSSNVGTIRHGEWSGYHCIGCSMVVGPDGDVRSSAGYGADAEELLVVEVGEPAA